MAIGELNTDGAGSGGVTGMARPFVSKGKAYRDARNAAAARYVDSPDDRNAWPPQHTDKDARGEAIDNHNLSNYADGKNK